MTATSSNTGLNGSINITRPHPGEHTIISGAAGNSLRLDFENEQGLAVTAVRGDLNFLFPDGGRVTLTGFYSDDTALQENIILSDGTQVTLEALLELADSSDMVTMPDRNAANDPLFESGEESYMDDPGKLLQGLDRLGMLTTDYWGREATHHVWAKGLDTPESAPVTPPAPDIIVPGALSAVLFMAEDGMPFKYMPTSGADPAVGSADATLEAGFNPVTGMPITMTLDSPGGTTGPNAAYVHSMTMTGLPSAAQGAIFYQGAPCSNGQIITSPDLAAFSFLPAKYYSGDAPFSFTYILATPATGPATVAQRAVGWLHVDSVADLPSASSEATGRTGDGDNISLAAPVFNAGWATQTVQDEDAMQVTFTVTVEYFDLDSSETGWLLISLPQGFSIPAGSGYTTFSDADGLWAKVPVSNLPQYAATGGVVDVPVTLEMDRSAVSGNKNLVIKAVSFETDTLNTDGHIITDNTAIRVIAQDVDVDLLAGMLTIQVGWAYENNETGGSATQDLSTIGLDQNSTTSVGAPISFNLTNGTPDQAVITLPAGSGGLYLGGTALTPDPTAPAGYVSYTVSGPALQSNTLTFRPTGHGDGDVPMSYVLTATDSNNKQFTFSGSTTIVIDAVADAGIINAPVTGVVEADDTTFVVTVNATFVDFDGSERHYILVESLPGWGSPDPFDLYTVYYDSSGNPLPPIAFDPVSGEYSFDISASASAVTYMRFDVTAQSIQAQGNPANYVARVIPPITATDTTLTVATLAEEYPANLSGREYDPANNIAINTAQVLINVVDSTVLISASPAYENHSPNQYLGPSAPSGTDGIILVSLSSNGDEFDSSADIVFTFSYNPADPTANPAPGSFFNYQTGLTYSFGSTTTEYSYTQIGPDQYQIVIHSGTILPGWNSFRLRYNPPQDDDTDLNNITCSASVKAIGSDATTILTTAPIDLVVDAVANKPTLVSVTPDYEPGYTAAVSGSTIPMTLTAQFGDYLDNSEQHYLVFDLNSGFSAIDAGSFPPGSVTQLTGAAISSAGLTAYTGSQYVVLQVANSWLAANNGLFSATVNATVDTVTQDSTLQLVVNAVAVDWSTDGGEITTANNYAGTQGSGSVVVHTVTSQPALHAAMAFENDTPNAHLGSASTAYGAAALSITGIDPSEAVSTIIIAWDPSLGTLYYNGAPISGSISGVTYVYDQAAGTLTLTGTGAAGVSATVISHLSFVPAYTYSDQDASLTYSGVITDTASGMTRTFGPGGSGSDIATAPVPVAVDAVAQQPTDATGSIEYPAGYSAAYNLMNISAAATFTDTADGSEKHYLLIEAKSYFLTAPQVGTDGITLLTVGYNGTTPLSPDGGGGWLNPHPSSPADQSMIATSSKTFFQIPVDSVISQFQSAPVGVPQTSGNFTVTLNADGSFTVSYNTTVFMDHTNMTEDFADTVATGGMSHETATRTGGDSYGGKEGYLYNNTAYNLENQTLDVAVAGTTNISVITGWATEDNSPVANIGEYYTGNGAGILAVRSDPGVAGQNYANEQITLTFTYYCLGKYSDGSWIAPGTIIYEFPGGAQVQTIISPAGLVTATVIISVNDTTSLVESAVSNPNPDSSHIRFVPGLQPQTMLGHYPDPSNPADYRNNYNEADIKLGYTAIATDLASGNMASVGGGPLTVVIDAVADQPVISNVQWQYGAGSDGTVYDAFSSANVTLELTVAFPDNAPDGAVSEGQYILIRQNPLMDLSPDFKLAVAQAGYVMENYTVVGDGAPYYRIPAVFFSQSSGAPAGSHQYDVVLPMIMTGGVSEGTLDAATLNAALKIIAQAVVVNAHGVEQDYTNNTALDTASVPDLAFAVVNSTVNPGMGYAYEDNAPHANVGDYTPPSDSAVQFTLGLTLGGSPGNGGTEVASDVTINYNGAHGTLYYNDGSDWIAVSSGNGVIPSAFADAPLKFVPVRLAGGTGDVDQRIQYSLTVTEPASGASRVFSGSALVMVDAVAEMPDQPTSADLAYGGGGSSVTYGGTVQFTVAARFLDFDKSGDSHSRFYFLIQQPTMNWTISYPNMAAYPYDTYVYNGVTYFRVPVDPSTFDAAGNADISITLTAPPEGTLLYDNANPSLDLYALSVARDPNLGPIPGGDQEITYTNNWAYSDAGSITIVYDDGGNAPWLVVDPLYENGMPNANQLDADGNRDSSQGGGKVYLAIGGYIPDSVFGQPTYVDGVLLTWNGSKATLMNADGTPVPDNIIIHNSDGTWSVHSEDLPDNGAGIYFVPAVGNSDLDIGTVKADFYNNQLGVGVYINTATYSPIVDAVAQAPTDLQSGFDYEAGYTAAPPGAPVSLTVSTVFGDPTANEEHYVLVQIQPGWSLPPGVNYTVIDGPNGEQYWQIPVDVSEIDQSTGACAVTVSLIPPSSGGTPGADGQVSYALDTGAMTVRIPTGGTDQEYTSANNVSYNLTGNAQVVVSGAESNPALNVTNTYAGSDPTGSGDPNPNVNANLYISGLNQGSDTISRVVLQFNNSNGDVTCNGMSLNGLGGVVYTVDASGNVTATITNPDIINALISGGAGSSAVRYVPGNYNDRDVPVTATITVNDNFSPDSKTVSNTGTIIVDAVALQPTDVSMDIPGYAGAVVPGSTIPVSVTATFPDLLSPSGSTGQHYMAIQQMAGWDVAGGLPPTIAVETYNGVTYYLVSVDLFGDGGSPYLVNNGNGSYTFTLPLSTPNYTWDVQNAVNISGGAVTVQSPTDLELTFNNNTAVVQTQLPISIAVVQTTEVDFTISGLTEDSAAGAVIRLNQTMLNTLNANNEIVLSTTLNFDGDFTGYAAGAQVGTVIYNGMAIPAISNGDGTASATIDFGPGGYSSSNNPTLIWGTVATDGSGNVIYSSPGVPQVDQWNHTGSDMTVSSSSTVQDKASLESKAGVPGSSGVAWTPTADAPTDLNAADPANPVGADAPVTFTVSGIFADIDGSEQHYFLVQQLPGWTGNYQTMLVDGVMCFVIPISSSMVANPSVDVTLNTPAGVTADGSYTLIVSGMSVDGASINTSSVTATVVVQMGVVNATGVSLTMAETNEYDGGTVPGTRMVFDWIGTPQNDTLNSITITDLQGGAITDAAGNVLFTGAPAILDGATALSDGYYYLPPEYGKGDYILTFSATASDNASNASTTFTGQTGTVTVNPVSTIPDDPSGFSSPPTDEAGHQSQVTVNLQANFNDYMGTEDHFFLVQLPAGVTPPAGWAPVTAASDPALYSAAVGAGWSGAFYKVEAASDGTAAFAVTIPGNTPADAITVQAGSTETSLSPPQYMFSPSPGSVDLPAIGPVNLPPDSVQETQNVADSNGARASGVIPLTDPDGDSVAVQSVTVGF